MADSYFDYILSKGKRVPISQVCQRYATRTQFIKSVAEDWGEYIGITSDSGFFYAVEDIYRQEEIIRYCDVIGDSKRIYERCWQSLKNIRIDWQKGDGLDYNRLFEALSDLCWLLASKQIAENGRKRNIILLDEPLESNNAIKQYLESRYDAAVRNHNESVYIADAIRVMNEHPFLHTKSDCQFEEAKKYVQEGWVRSDLQNAKVQYESFCLKELRIYYGLTATAIHMEDIRRMYL